MRWVFISDTHGNHNELDLPVGDVLVHCGDITMMGELDVLDNFNQWIGKQDFTYKIVIAGNHDKSLYRDPFLGYKLLTNCIYLNNESVKDIFGLKVWGSPWTPTIRPGFSGTMWGFDKERKDMKGIWRGMPRDVDILVTHGPPFGILDRVPRGFDEAFEIENNGDKMLAAKVIEYKPMYHAFGHIHEEGGKTFKTDYGTTCINCSVLNEAYKLVNEPIVIDI